MPQAIFVINPGSTTTKTALFLDDQCVFERSVAHDPETLAPYQTIADQLPMRMAAVESALMEAVAKTDMTGPEAVAAFVGRGGLIHPVSSGVYTIDFAMCADLKSARYGEHASNLGALIAADLGSRFEKPAFIVDPVTVDEFEPVARVTGLPEIKRRSTFHALNHKAVARRAAADLGVSYEETHFVVAHMGGGISIAAHANGRVIDVNDALNEGPLSPERAGSLPILPVIDMAFSGQYDRTSLRRRINGKGGLVALVGTSDCKLIEEQALIHPEYAAALDAMVYQIAKWIGAMAVVLEGRTRAIVLTGGLARSAYLTSRIRDKVEFLAQVLVYPGEAELAALAAGAQRVLEGREQPKSY